MSGPVTIRKALTRLALCLAGVLAALFLVSIVASLVDDDAKPDPVITEPVTSAPVETTGLPEPGTTAPTGALGEKPEIGSTPTARKRATKHFEPSASATRTTAPAEVYYQNCTAVRAAGAAPLYRGDPGYASHLDRNGDGVACEA
jgi:Excalibur calcium-binding domain